MGRDKLTIVVSGMVAGDPHQGGATWAVLQYILGFRRLGHAVSFLEPKVDAEYFRQVDAEFGLPNDPRADVLFNISGMLTDESILNQVPIRVYLDIDPAFNQLWHAAQGINMRFAGHTHYVTIGLNLGQPDCPV